MTADGAADAAILRRAAQVLRRRAPRRSLAVEFMVTFLRRMADKLEDGPGQSRA